MNTPPIILYVFSIYKVVPHAHNQDSLLRIAFESETPLTRTALPFFRSISHASMVDN